MVFVYEIGDIMKYYDFVVNYTDNGYICISTIVTGVRRHRLYIGYTETQAKGQFCQYLAGLQKKDGTGNNPE